LRLGGFVSGVQIALDDLDIEPSSPAVPDSALAGIAARHLGELTLKDTSQREAVQPFHFRQGRWSTWHRAPAPRRLLGSAGQRLEDGGDIAIGAKVELAVATLPSESPRLISRGDYLTDE